MPASRTHTRLAIAVIAAAAQDEADIAGWLAGVLAAAASELGATSALTAGRPASRAAALVEQLVHEAAAASAGEPVSDRDPRR
jgi:hypothetical protein